MKIAERIGAIAVAGLLAIAVMTPGSAGAQSGRIAAGAFGDWRAYPYRHAALACYHRPGPYRDAAQFWKSYQFYYAGCRRPPVRPEFDWDYLLVCCYGY